MRPRRPTSRPLLGSLASIAVASALAAGCGSDPLAVPADCNPLAADLDCLLPFPSDHFLVGDAQMPSGRRVAFPEAPLVHTPEGEAIDPTILHPADGWSLLPSIFALLPGAVDDSNLIFHTGPVLDTREAKGPTLLIDEAGTPLLHFAELDPRPQPPEPRALFVRPMQRLTAGTRHVVAFRDLRGLDGELLPAPEGFRRIRDGKTRGDPILDPLAERYEEEIFPLLEAAGVDRDSLQLAWDFTTRSDEQVSFDLRTVRETVMTAFAAAPPVVRITEVLEDVDDPDLFRRITGTIRVPLFTEEDRGGSLLTRDPEGAVVSLGEAEVPFLATVPRSVAEAVPVVPAGIVQFGHGFFGGRDEIGRDFSPPFANQTGMLMIAVDWQGMARADSVVIGGDLIDDLGRSGRFVDRVHQGMANQLALAYAVRSSLLTEAAFQQGGVTLYDPEQLHFYGLSNGHILGGTFLGISPFHPKAVLSVGGAGFNFMMFRARPFEQLLGLLAAQVPDLLDQQKVTALIQLGLDRVDPITYTPRVLTHPLTGGVEDRRILMQIGLGDSSVPNLASHIHARSLGLSQWTPGPRTLPALPEVSGPFDGSALVEFDFGIAEPLPGTYALIAPEGNAVHGGVRGVAAGIEQIDRFLAPGGQIEQTCDGVCDTN